MHVRKGDQVVVIAGKEKGKRGRVLRLVSDKGRVVIERVNMVKRHTRPRGPQQTGGIVEKEAPIPLSNLMLMCDKCNAPVRIGHKDTTGEGKARVCRRCGDPLD